MSKGGAREGAGRKPGEVTERTLKRLQAKRQLINRTIKNTNRLFNAQLDKAIGEKFLIVKITERGTKGGVQRVYHEVVEDPETIIAYLDGELEGGESISTDDRFYYMTTKPADNNAIANMLDRAYGKPTEKVDLGGNDEDELDQIDDKELDERIARYLELRQRSRA